MQIIFITIYYYSKGTQELSRNSSDETGSDVVSSVDCKWRDPLVSVEIDLPRSKK